MKSVEGKEQWKPPRSEETRVQGQGLATPLTLEPSIRSNLTSPHPLLLLPHSSQLFTSVFVTYKIAISHLTPYPVHS